MLDLEVLGLLCTSLPGTGCSGPEPSALSISCRCRSWLPALPPPRGTELTHTTHHFSLSSPGEGAPVDFSNPSSLFLIIVCEPRGAAASTARGSAVMPVISSGASHCQGLLWGRRGTWREGSRVGAPLGISLYGELVSTGIDCTALFNEAQADFTPNFITRSPN